jgi:hypothetical protein
MKKISRMNEIAWVIGIVGCALGVCLCTKANFGLSMIAAPPYIFHVALREHLPWYTQGTSEYIWQGVLLLIMCLVTGRFRWKYLLSFGTAVISGLCIDSWFLLLGGNGAYDSLWMRIVAFVFGAVFTSLSIAFVFRTSWPIAIYELLVREIADRFRLNINRVKPRQRYRNAVSFSCAGVCPDRRIPWDSAPARSLSLLSMRRSSPSSES